MSIVQRLRRLEQVEREVQLNGLIERLAARHGTPPDEVRRRVFELQGRIARWGIDAELRRLAQEYGKPEDEIRRDYEERVKELSL